MQPSRRLKASAFARDGSAGELTSGEESIILIVVNLMAIKLNSVLGFSAEL
jgi:hypothetical protein